MSYTSNLRVRAIFVTQVPAALSNIAQEVIYKEEKKVKKKEESTNIQASEDGEKKEDSTTIQPGEKGEKKEKINMVYALFWTYFCIFASCVLGFWTDLIPGFGTTTNFSLFLKL